jgi:membrane protease YdiL (CAAX protease family)
MQDSILISETDTLDTVIEKSSFIHYMQCILFVGIWITLGFVLNLDPNSYLLIGIPMMIAFQLFVRKKPVYQLWVRDGSSFQLDKLGILIAGCLMIYPCFRLVSQLINNEWGPGMLWNVAGIMGAVAAAYSIRQFRKETFRHTLLCLTTSGVISISLFTLAYFAQTTLLHKQFQPSLLTGIKSLLLYFPVCFMLEEVIFRGMIDPHIHRQSDKKGIWSAIFIGVLWGLFHLPVTLANAKSSTDIIGGVFSLIFVHTIVGIPLSIYYRKSGNLAVPSFSHAIADSFRNGLLRTL